MTDRTTTGEAREALDVQTIENANCKDVRPGDRIAWTHVEEIGGVAITYIREGIAHHLDEEGDWRTKRGMWIAPTGWLSATLTIRRTVPVRDALAGVEGEG